MADYETSLKIDAPMASVRPMFGHLARSMEWKVEASDGDEHSAREPYSMILLQHWPVRLEADFEADQENRTRVFYRASMTGMGPVVGAILRKSVASFHEKLGMLAGDAGLEQKVDDRADKRYSGQRAQLQGVAVWIAASVIIVILALVDAPAIIVAAMLLSYALGAIMMWRGWWQWVTN